jgi:O-antigen/teichoic acid export membrane protein
MASLGKSFFWLFVAEFLFYLSGYVVHMGAGRILGVEDYGRYTLVITGTLLVANLIGAGLPIAMGKFLSASLGGGETAFAQMIKKKVALWQSICMLFIGGIFFLVSPALARLLGDPELVTLFMMASFIIPLYGADLFYFHYYSGLKRFDIQSWLKFFRAILRMSVILGLAYWFHLEGMIAGYLLVPLFVFGLAWAIDVFSLKKTFKIDQRVSTAKENVSFSFRDVFHLAGFTVLFLVFFEILVSFDVYVIKYLTGDDNVVGNYSAALTIARIPTFLFYALTIILLPTISEARALKDMKRARELLSLAFRYMLIVTAPLVVTLMVYNTWLPVFLFGAEFAGAGSFLIFLGIALGVLTILYVFGFAFVGAGKGGIPVIIGGSAIIINMLAIGVFYGHWGVVGIAFSKVLVAIFVCLGILFASWKVFSLTVSWKDILGVIGFSIVLYGGLMLLGDNTVNFFVGVPLGVCIYFILLWFSGIVSQKDMQILRKKA